jgi:predicted nucleic acid-binding protein
MSMATHLADTSAWFLAQRRDAPSALRDSFSRLVIGGGIAICGAVKWEVLHSSRNAAEYRDLRARLGALSHVPFADADWERALDVCHELASRGGSLHRAPSISDAMIAVAAERAGLAVLHYDKDFDLIAEVTGQPCEWIVPRGSL